MNIKKTILVTDDEVEIRAAIKDIINDYFPDQFDIDEAVDGVDAIEKLEKKKYNLLITDLKMPRKDGQALIKMSSLLQSERKPDYILVVSAFINENAKKEIQSVSFLSKPFVFDDIIQYIKATILK